MTVIFDMDGLMFDTERIAVLAWDYAGEKLGIGKAGYLIPHIIGLRWERISAFLCNEFGEDFDAELFHTTVSGFIAVYYKNHHVPVKPGLYSILELLKQNKVKTAVASSSPLKTVEYNLNDAGIMDCFDVILSGDEVKKSKPDPDIFLLACEKLGAEPEDCYVLEDSRNGLLAAHSAGCKAVMVPDLWQPDEEIMSIIVGCFESLNEVREYLEQVLAKG